MFRPYKENVMPACALNLKSESETTTFSPVKIMVNVIFPNNICVLFNPHPTLPGFDTHCHNHFAHSCYFTYLNLNLLN
jgi:hypothetical protein